MIETETIECPACKTAQDVKLYQTINAMINPELVQKLIAGDVNILKCGRWVIWHKFKRRYYSTTTE